MLRKSSPTPHAKPLYDKSNRQLLQTGVVIALVWLLMLAVAMTKLAAQSVLTITPIADQFTPQNTPLSVQVTINDANPASVLMLGLADNPGLIPNENIVISQSGAVRQMTITPTLGRTGSTVITLIATNAVGQNAQITFNITVGGANPAPVLSAISPVSTVQNRPVTVNFTITDPNPSALTVAATSENPNVVAQSGLQISGTGSSRQLTITPVFGQIGSAVITVSATNTSGFSARQSFTVMVSAVSQAAPSITSPGDQIIAMNQSGNALFNVLDLAGVQNVNVFASSSNPVLIPDANITISGIGSSRTVMMRPVAGRTGEATIVLQALNASGQSAATAFRLYVVNPFEPPVIRGLRDTTILQNTTLVMQYSVIDANPTTLVQNPNSASPDIIPESGLRITGNGLNSTLTITPNQNRIGIVPINLFVQNQNSLSSLEVFRVTIVAPPVLGTIPPLSTRINTSVQTTLSVTDANPQTVQFTASSSNTDLIPNANIGIGAGGINRTITITPAANRIGTATITLTARNSAGLTAVTSFPVTVFQPQTPPSIGTIPSLATQRNVPVSAMFSVGDADVNSLRFSFTSSNPGVFPAGNIIVNGTGTTRIVTLTPAPNVTGSAVITMTVTNSAGLSAMTSFTATVVPPPAPPTLSAIINLTTERNRPVTMPFVLSDEDIPSVQLSASSNNPALLPNGNLQFGGAGGMRSITITPGFNQIGSGVVTITAVNRQGQTATLTINVTVTPLRVPPTISPIGNVVIGQNQSAIRQFTVTDENLNLLTFSAESSNPALLLPSGLSVSGAGNTRTLIIAPNFGQIGISEARLTVTNQLGLSANTSFLVTVVPPPSITPPPVRPPDMNVGGVITLVTRVNTPTTSTFGVNDNTGFPLRFTAQSSNPQLIPVGNVQINRDGNNVHVVFTPTENEIGRARITITASNGFASSTIVYEIEVLPNPVVASRIPFLIAPPNNSVGLSPNTNQFRWSRVPGAVLYQVQIANDSLFQLIYLNNAQLLDTFWTVTTFNVERQYFWRVRALFGLTPGEWSEVWTFRTGRVRPGGTASATLSHAADTNTPLAGVNSSEPPSSQTNSSPQEAVSSSAELYINSSYNRSRQTAGNERARLIANVPNPFSETTRIEYELDDDMEVRLEITDILGRQVAELVRAYQPAGSYALHWHAGSLPSGVYICTLHTPSHILRKQMVIQR